MLYKVKSRLKYNGGVYKTGDKIRVEKEDPLFGSDILELLEEAKKEEKKEAPKKSGKKK